MNSSVRRLVSMAAPGAGFVLGAWCFAWPAWREGTQLFADAKVLERRVESFGDQAQALEQLATRVSDSRRRESLQTKAIPPSADLADVISALSTSVDGTRVVDQTFTGGKPGPAVVGDVLPFEAMPLTIDMTARFDAVFSVLKSAEQMNRLVRVASLRVSRPTENRDSKDAVDVHDSDIVVATIGLEAVYETALPPAAPASTGGSAR